MTKDIVIFGMQGSGKGTQGEILAKKHGFTIFETGKELRKIREENSNLGRKIKSIMDRGDLVTNSIVMEIVENFFINNKNKKILFDGIPRSMEQKETFDALLKKYNKSIEGIYLILDEGTAIERMLERGRSDDSLEVIKKRLENYHNETIPVIDEYVNEGIMTEIDATGTIEDIEAIIDNLLLIK
jgi:adenylate kinase